MLIRIDIKKLARFEHATYANAIAMAVAKNGTLKNDEEEYEVFEAVGSVPSVELWLLLHFASVKAWLQSSHAVT